MSSHLFSTLWFFLIAGSIQAQGLIESEIDPVAFAVDTSHEQVEGLRYRYVRLNLSAIGPTTRLNLFQDADFSAVHDRTERQLQTTIWIGHIPNPEHSLVYLSRNDSGQFFGKIEIDDRVYQIVRRGEDIYAVVEINLERLIESEDDGSLPENDPGAETGPGGVSSVCDPLATCAATTVDLMVVYTQAARTALGGTDAAAESAIATAIAEMNTANLNSEVIHSYNLVFTSVVNYTESGSISTDRDRLISTTDNILDEVHIWRDTYNADLVALIVNTGGCGISRIQTDPSNSAFGLNRTICRVAEFRVPQPNVLFVDASVPVSGDGSAAFPFKTVSEAAAVAVHGTILHIRDGTYASGSRPIQLLNRHGLVRTSSGIVTIR